MKSKTADTFSNSECRPGNGGRRKIKFWDRKIEFPKPDMEARARIMQIHARKMNVDENVNFDELSRCTEDFNGAQCKAVCVEAGMIALRHEVRKYQ